MMKIIPILTFFLFIHKASAENPAILEPADDSVLKLELSEQEGAKKEFQHLVQSTMELMGPNEEMAVVSKPQSTHISK